jgi:hypothetical protein
MDVIGAKESCSYKGVLLFKGDLGLAKKRTQNNILIRIKT